MITPDDAVVSPPLPDSPVHPTPAGVSPTLYNEDLAPTMRAGRTWRSYNIFALWANDVHSLGNYAFAIGLFALGLGGWQILVALGLGGLFLFLLLNLSGFMGEKTGVPFPVMSRISFGIRGAQVPALIRGAVAIAWFGIQTFLASVVFRVMIVAVFPGAKSLDANSILGLSTLGWIAFLILWVVQMVIVSYGMETIRKYEAFAGPVILLTMSALAIWMFIRAGGSIAWTTPASKTGVDMWLKIIGDAGLWVAIYGTFVLNFCDFTRSATSRIAIVRGNFFGIPINMLVFGAIVVVLAGAQYKINGKVIESPADIVATVPNTFLLVMACLALLILTVAVNLMANFVAPIYALTNLFPTKLNFRRAGVVSGVIGLIILPWNLYNSPAVITYFLGGLGAILGPLFGIIMADYWLIRRARVNVPDLYTTAPDGDYHYSSGVNPRAVIALIPTAGVALLLAFVPAFSSVSSFSWFIGAGLGAIVYLLVADRNREFTDVSGEAIAVPSKH
ncbi:NCS1 family nucleobase:cation symporter-1 [Gordonia sp. TBRC 11910]|uniref:NCS1 family nucleobase:cation symporter-1 n=1 Tax=Gordonia asplenii TaxID=2725283 RepID=A0A848KXU3_9ACTN|nr:NCS1 family nucleobase:cation symporter-1 [Gordonia asplenii]NMO00278.1 NCS1 family nucleobase:cation symporter-1 [Gordonia asplenii]